MRKTEKSKKSLLQQNMLDEIKEITFEITNRCNLQCQICNIWREKDKHKLGLKEIKKILNDFTQPITVSLTGGEPLLNNDFENIYRYLFKLYLKKMVKNIDVATNLYSNRIIVFLEKNQNYLAPLSLSVSLDGIGATHDTQRGKRGSFNNTLKNILLIRKYGIPITLKSVLTSINYNDIFKVNTLAKKLDCAYNIKMLEILKSYYHRCGNLKKLCFSQNKHLSKTDILDKIARVKKSARPNSFAYFNFSCLHQFLTNNNLNFIKKCLSPRYSLFFTSKGDVYNCLYQPKIGSISKWPSLNLEYYTQNISKAESGRCPKCLSFHGYLKQFNKSLL